MTTASLKELIARATQRCGHPELAESIYKTIVVDNWVDSVDALANLGPNEWAQLKLPVKLVSELRAELALLRPNSSPADIVHTPLPVFRAGHSYQAEPWAGIDLAVTLEIVVASTWPQPSALRLLSKIVENCLKDPNDTAKRRLRATNPTIANKLLNVTGCYEFLTGVGFVDDGGDNLVLSRLYLDRLEQAKSLLCKELARLDALVTPSEALQSGVLKFDPFQSTQLTHRTDVIKPADRNAYSPEALREAIKRELHLREHGGHSDVVPLNPTYSAPHMNPPVGRVQSSGDCSDDTSSSDQGSKPVLSAEALAHLKDLMTGSIKFRSSLSQQLVALRKVPVYRQAQILLIAPNRSSVRFSVRPDTTTAELYEIVQHKLLRTDTVSLLLASKAVFWISDPPLRPRIVADKETTVFHLGLVPTGQLRVMSSLTDQSKLPWLREVFTS